MGKLQAGVVIVEDSAHWLRRLELAVHEIAGLTIAGSAGTPAAAVELVSRLHPPILILDLHLPGGSGVDVLRALDGLEFGTRVVIVTGHPSERLRAVCLQLGARYFFDKALEWERLQPALRTLQEEVEMGVYA